MTVLVLAAETDRTADSVVTGLAERNVPIMRVDMSWFPQNMSLDAEFRDGECRGILRTAHHEVDLAEIRSVWVRTPSAYAFPDALSAAERDFARREAKVGMGGALLSLPGVLWVNRPDLAATAVYRPLQWAVAARCGLAVPRTLVTNDPHAVKRFAKESRHGVVVKPLTANLIYEDHTYKMGWTRRLSTDDLADLSGIEVTAHLIQDWVDKVWECRAVLVGDEVFAVAIYSGSDESRVDWRSDYPSLFYEIIDLPSVVADSLRAIMAELGLVYGAFDLSVSREGSSEVFWFLEINPGGQYGFLEGATGIRITDSLVRFLAAGVTE
ncbi:MAG: ATP-grasp ribosomal peptide maturase [Pseudonocardiaceae bacterium]